MVRAARHFAGVALLVRPPTARCENETKRSSTSNYLASPFLHRKAAKDKHKHSILRTKKEMALEIVSQGRGGVGLHTEAKSPLSSGTNW